MRDKEGYWYKNETLHDLKAMILRLKESGLNNTKIAEKLGIDRKKVSRIVNSIIS